MRKTVIVTGANGFLGRHTCRALAACGYSVAGIGHGDWSRPEWNSWGLDSWRKSDITVSDLHSCCDRASAIVHLAGGSSVAFSSANPHSDFNQTVGSTCAVMDYVRSMPHSPKVLYISSCSVYGNAGLVQIPETQSPSPISVYGLHKWLAEQLTSSYSRQYGISSVIIRFFSLYGPYLRKQLLWDACRKLSAGDSRFSGTGEELRDWLHVEDATKLITLAARKPIRAGECIVLNGGTGEGASVRTVLTRIAECIDSPKSRIEFSGTTRPGDPDALVADITRANSWGWQPIRPLTKGIAEYVAWWNDEHRTKRANETRASAALP